MKLFLIIYDLLLFLSIPFYLLGLALRGRWRPFMFERFGIIPKDRLAKLKRGNTIWLHAVSLGEVSTCKLLISRLSDLYPKKTILITTVTNTGRLLAESLRGDNLVVIYVPFDLSFFIKSFIDRIKPMMLILVETELWPNLLNYTKKYKIPVVVINGRLSDSSFKKYSYFKWFIKYFSKDIQYFCVQSELEKKRFSQIGIPPEKITVTGNMKFDVIEEINEQQLSILASLKQKISRSDNEFIIVAGSTHNPEEEYVLDAFLKLKEEFPFLRLIIAPRHLERLNEIEEVIATRYLVSQRLSKIDLCKKEAVMLVDTVGRLRLIYSFADLVFMGGSLVPKGGQNILEPAYFKKPILVGPYMHNFRAITQYFLSHKGIIQLHHRDEMFEAIRSLLLNKEKVAKLGDIVKSLLVAKQGATSRNLDIIKAQMS